MHLPESAQDIQGGLRQGHETVFIALGIADMYPVAQRIDICYL
jgi:hypothetical protein